MPTDTIPHNESHSAQEFSIQVKQQAMKNAILSACFGAVAQIMVADSSVIILYAGMLQASRFVSLCTTSLQLLSLCLFYIPIAYWMSKFGRKKPVMLSFAIGGLVLGSIIFAPYAGNYKSHILIGGLGLFSICMAVATVGWFPILRDIVPDDQRGRFFGRMRISWQLVSVVFLTISALVVRKWGNIETFQIIIFICSVGLLGRAWFTAKLPAHHPKGRKLSMYATVLEVLSSNQLMGYGTYLFWLYLFAGATIPVAIVMCKLYLHISGSFLIALSSCYMVGCIIGFYIGGKVVDRHSTRPVFMLAHFSFSVLNLLFLTIHHDSIFSRGMLIFICVFYGITFACASIAVSSKAFAVVPADYPDVGLAVCLGLYCAGFGLSRFLAGWVLDSGMLADQWYFFGLEMTPYHTLFLIYAVGVLITSFLLTMIPALIVPRRTIPNLR